jgi:hypothetical protein
VTSSGICSPGMSLISTARSYARIDGFAVQPTRGLYPSSMTRNSARLLSLRAVSSALLAANALEESRGEGEVPRAAWGSVRG